MKTLYGVVAAMTTPFTADGQVDMESLKQQADFLIEKGVHCLYPCGTTGEMYLMDEETRKQVAEAVVKHAAGRVTVFIHCGAMNEEETLRLCKHAHAIGADGVGVVTPSYFYVQPTAMVEYYRRICSQLPMDFSVYVYVIPQLAVNDIDGMTMELIAEACPNVVGVKYSFADMRRFIEYLKVRDGHFSVLFSPDDLFLPALVMGSAGTVSGCASCIPEPFVEIYRAFRAGEYDKARKLQLKCFDMVRTLKGGSNMSIFKNVQTIRGLQGGHMHLPLLDLNEDEIAKLRDEVAPYLSVN